MKEAKKKLKDAIVNEQQAQEKQISAENKYNDILPKAKKAKTQRQHELEERNRISQATTEAGSEERRIRENIVLKYATITDKFDIARNAFFLANTDLRETKETLTIASAEYDAAKTNYETLLTQKAQTQK